uniref:Reverse transcriptase RNase H-like domain-containing protein n=1 Tax=Tanacetum cinerariifolium TaxID=118510 RepID=A0A6L2NQQ6_TANCI|nr:hypothetical protein [Tanacetum cinerariifolium]
MEITSVTLVRNKCPRGKVTWFGVQGVWSGGQGGDRVVWLALELKGGNGGACGLLESRFRIDSKSLNNFSLIVVLDLSKVAIPLFTLRDKDLFKSKDPQVAATAKLPILNPNEFNLWKMRIEQYFLMTDYSLWEVILNGNSPTPTRIVDGVVKSLLLPLQSKDAKSLTKAIEKRFEGNRETKKVQKTHLKQQYENFRRHQIKILKKSVIRVEMIQQVQNSCQFHGLQGDDANKHLDKFLHVTQSIKVNEVTDDALHLYLFPHSLTDHATDWRLEECYDLIENMTTHHNDWDTSAQQSDSSSSITSSFDTEIAALKAEMTEINKNLMRANDAILKNMQTNMTSLTNSNLELKNMFGQFMKMNTASSSGSRTLPGNTVTNPKEELKGITTRSGTAYQGPMIPPTSSSLPQLVEHETEVTKDMMPPTNNESTKDVQPTVVQIKTLILNSEPVVDPIIKSVVAPVSAPKPNQKPLIPYPSRLHDQKLRDKANDQKEKIFKIFQDINFDISFADALILMPKKTREPGKFLISCDFLGMDESLALADLGASINLMPLSVWKKISLPKLSPTFVDFDADPRVPLILGRSFLKTERSLIDVFEGELTLRVGKKAITFNLDQTSRYSANYNDMTANRIDVIDMSCEDSSSNLTPFGDSDFLLEEVNAFLALEDDPTSLDVDQSYFDPDEDILLLEAFLNDDPSLPPPNQGNYLPQVLKELKISEAKTDKSSIDKPLEVELKDVPPHLGYAFLEGNDKFPVIIAKDLSVEEKIALIMVLKSHKRAITWKLPDIKEKMLKWCEDTHLCLNWEKSHFMVKEGIVLSHKISKNRIEVVKAKVDVIAKLPHPTTVKGVVLGQRQEKKFRPIHYASKTMTEEESNYTSTKKEMLAMVYAFKKFWSYLIMSKSIMYTDHFVLKYLFAKKDSKARLLRWVLLRLSFSIREPSPVANNLGNHAINLSFQYASLQSGLVIAFAKTGFLIKFFNIAYSKVFTKSII